jgi:uncharacterized OsmC-like protein
VLEYHMGGRRIDAPGSEATAKDARIVLDTDLAGRADAFNAAEMLLASVAACMLRSVERFASILNFDLRGVEVKLHCVRQDNLPKIVAIDCELVVDTDESDRRLDLLHANIRKYGTISNTVAEATTLQGTIRRKT